MVTGMRSATSSGNIWEYNGELWKSNGNREVTVLMQVCSGNTKILGARKWLGGARISAIGINICKSRFHVNSPGTYWGYTGDVAIKPWLYRDRTVILSRLYLIIKFLQCSWLNTGVTPYNNGWLQWEKQGSFCHAMQNFWTFSRDHGSSTVPSIR